MAFEMIRTKTKPEANSETETTTDPHQPVGPKNIMDSSGTHSAVFNGLLTAFETYPAGIVLTETDGTCLLLNPAAETFLRTRRRDGGRDNILNIAPNDTVRNVFESLLEICAVTGKGSREFKFNGINYQASVLADPNHPDTPKVFILSVENISSKTQIEKKKDELLALVSHELRTPLCVIKGYLDILSNDMLGTINHEMDTCINVMKEQCTSLDLRIKDLIRYSGLSKKQEVPIPELINMRKFLETFLDRYQASLKSTETTVTLSVEDPALSCWCDAGHLSDIVRHLLDNAIKFSSAGAFIEIRSELFDLKNLPESDSRITSNEPNPRKSWILLEVEDTGPGIPENKIRQVFESFEQAEDHLTRSSRGLGLGLAMVKEIVSVYDGTLWINTVPNRGTVVSVLLPSNDQPYTSGAKHE
jgi:signal transduction histidine kinase